MTAFVRHDTDLGAQLLAIEIRSVNHRYLDVSFRLPDTLRQLEPALRNDCTEALGRGKVEVGMRLQAAAGAAGSIAPERLAGLIEQLDRIGAALRAAGLETRPVDPALLLAAPGLLESRATLATTDASAVRRGFAAALQALIESRRVEGAGLAEACRQRLAAMQPLLEALRTENDGIAAEQQARLLRRLTALKVDLPPDRLAQEVAVLAQRLDIAEELDRLELHVGAARQALDGTGPIGRRLDFLMQEFGREANTIASKSASTAVSGTAVELKVLIEQIREQVQNIE